MQDKHLQWKRVQVLVLRSDSVRKEVEDEPALKKGNDDTGHAVAPPIAAVRRFCNGQGIHTLDLLNKKIVRMLELGYILSRSIPFQPHGVLIDRHRVISPRVSRSLLPVGYGPRRVKSAVCIQIDYESILRPRQAGPLSVGWKGERDTACRVMALENIEKDSILGEKDAR